MDVRHRPFSRPFHYDKEGLKQCAMQAGDAIMDYFTASADKNNDHLDIHMKEDHSPVCNADKAAHDIIAHYLSQHFPDIPILSEEDPFIETKRKDIDPDGMFFAVDPLDGTQTFIQGGKDFSVNIALIDKGFPRIGVI